MASDDFGLQFLDPGFFLGVNICIVPANGPSGNEFSRNLSASRTLSDRSVSFRLQRCFVCVQSIEPFNPLGDGFSQPEEFKQCIAGISAFREGFWCAEKLGRCLGIRCGYLVASLLSINCSSRPICLLGNFGRLLFLLCLRCRTPSTYIVEYFFQFTHR